MDRPPAPAHRLSDLQPMTGRLHLSTQAWATITQEVRAATDGLETGGILLGHQHDDYIQITAAGDPGPNAEREPTRFLRDLGHAQRLADSAWETDCSQWIGEWHTHPHSEPTPSAIDLGSYARHLDDPDLALTHFVSVIIGRVADGTAVAAWVITDGAATLTPLTIEGATT